MAKIQKHKVKEVTIGRKDTKPIKVTRGNKYANGEMRGKSPLNVMERDHKAAEKLLDISSRLLTENEFIVFTDSEIIAEINLAYELEDVNRRNPILIRYETFLKWKGRWTKGDTQFFERTPSIGKFMRYYEGMIRKSKKFLFQMLQTDDKWQRYAWILERKYKEWRLNSDRNESTPHQQMLNIVMQLPQGVEVISNERQMIERYGDSNAEDAIIDEEESAVSQLSGEHRLKNQDELLT